MGNCGELNRLAYSMTLKPKWIVSGDDHGRSGLVLGCVRSVVWLASH
jgi:hypothetical protein